MFGKDFLYRQELKLYGLELVKDVNHLAIEIDSNEYVVVTHAVLEFAGEMLDKPLYAINDGTNQIKFGHVDKYVFVESTGVN